MVCIHTVVRACTTTPVVAMVYRLAPTTCPTYYCVTPNLKRRCGVDWVFDLGRYGCGGGVGGAHQWGEGSELGHGAPGTDAGYRGGRPRTGRLVSCFAVALARNRKTRCTTNIPELWGYLRIIRPLCARGNVEHIPDLLPTCNWRRNRDHVLAAPLTLSGRVG